MTPCQVMSNLLSTWPHAFKARTRENRFGLHPQMVACTPSQLG